MKEKLLAITDGVATYNADPFCISDAIEDVRASINKAGEIIAHTPEDTEEEEWETMCEKLDLGSVKEVRRIYEVRGAYTMLLADSNDYTI